jgi:hypothetical protein
MQEGNTSHTRHASLKETRKSAEGWPMTVTMTAGTLLLPLSAELERSVTVRLPSLQGSGLPRGVQGMPFWCRQEKFVECKFEAGEDPPKCWETTLGQGPK